MFSISPFIRSARSAISDGAVVEGKLHSLGSQRAVYCLRRLFSGSTRMRARSSRFNGWSSTLIGNRPGVPGQGRTLTLEKAPAVMKRTWSVLSEPYFVGTGNLPLWKQISLHSLPADVRAAAAPSPRRHLSISSMKTILPRPPFQGLLRTTASMSTSFSASSARSRRRASKTFILRRFVLFGSSRRACR